MLKAMKKIEACSDLIQQLDKSSVVSEVLRRLNESGQTLSQAIAERNLYLRISVLGKCNLSCTFCHNEGGPFSGIMERDQVEAIINTGKLMGFTRVQFTGGEPLLHPNIAEFVSIAKKTLSDIGITTNGTYLYRRLDNLLEAGLQRLHVSLQVEPLLEAGGGDSWEMPEWLLPTVKKGAEGSFQLRLNLPIPSDSLMRAEHFLIPLTEKGISVKVFSILPTGASMEEKYPIDQLNKMVERVNAANRFNTTAGHVELRGYRPPSGFRCTSCRDFRYCKEMSHSLRVGADLTLRPCLASRAWDMPLEWPLDPEALYTAFYTQSLLALDYSW
jgi:cyclic pyranopterin phosphate synthase